MNPYMSRVLEIKNEDEKAHIKQYLTKGTYPHGASENIKRVLRRKAANLSVVNDLICFKKDENTMVRAVFSYETDLIAMIIKEEHSPGHIGASKLIHLINQKYYGIPAKMVRDYIKNCDACSHYNDLTTIQPVKINNIVAKYDRYMMDCMDLRKYASDNDNYKWILNVIDTYTKYLWSFKLQNKSAESIKTCLVYIFNNYGIPRTIQADNGREFKNNVLSEYLKTKNIQIIHGRPRNPQAQGQVERVNQTVKRRIAKCLHVEARKRWIDVHDSVVYSYNITKHRATNKSPFKLFHGQNGFNNEIAEYEITENESDGSVIDMEYSLECNYSFDETQCRDIDIISENNDAAEINLEVMNHFNAYRDNLLKTSNTNSIKAQIYINDHVLLKNYFDNNTATRKAPFESQFENGKYIVVEILANNMVRVKELKSEVYRVAHLRSIKKINL